MDTLMLTAKDSKVVEIDITKGYNPVRFPVIDNQTTYNLYEFEGAMIPTPGFKKIYSIDNEQKARGLFSVRSRRTSKNILPRLSLSS